MTEPLFFKRAPGLSAAEIAAMTGAEPRAGTDLVRRITDIAALDRAGPGDLAFVDSPKYADGLATTQAGICLVGKRFAAAAPPRLAVLVAPDAFRSFVEVARALFPAALRPSSLFEAGGAAVGAQIHPAARLENGVTVDPGAVIGPRAEIGAGTVIAANAVIGPDVRIGRDCAIGVGTSVMYALVGDRVIIHPGCHVGQDGFGFVMGAEHRKIPQVGRVIIQDDVEIGAGTTIDRGFNRDTVIGEGTKIDNLVQVGHNVTVGRHCILVAQVGLAGSATLGDYVALGARAGVNNHVTVGEGAQLAGTSIANSDVPPGARWGGVPAKPVKQWFREMLMVERLAARDTARKAPGTDEGE